MNNRVIAPSINTCEREFDRIFSIPTEEEREENTIDLLNDNEKYDLIIRVVCTVNHIEPKSVFIKKNGKLWRKREIVESRHMIFHMVKLMIPNRSLIWIGVKFGQDHASVLHGLRNVRNLMDTDKGFRLKMEKVKENISELYRKGKGKA